MVVSVLHRTSQGPALLSEILVWKNLCDFWLLLFLLYSPSCKSWHSLFWILYPFWPGLALSIPVLTQLALGPVATSPWSCQSLTHRWGLSSSLAKCLGGQERECPAWAQKELIMYSYLICSCLSEMISWWSSAFIRIFTTQCWSLRKQEANSHQAIVIAAYVHLVYTYTYMHIL